MQTKVFLKYIQNVLNGINDTIPNKTNKEKPLGVKPRGFSL